MCVACVLILVILILEPVVGNNTLINLEHRHHETTVLPHSPTPSPPRYKFFNQTKREDE